MTEGSAACLVDYRVDMQLLQLQLVRSVFPSATAVVWQPRPNQFAVRFASKEALALALATDGAQWHGLAVKVLPSNLQDAAHETEGLVQIGEKGELPKAVMADLAPGAVGAQVAPKRCIVQVKFSSPEEAAKAAAQGTKTLYDGVLFQPSVASKPLEDPRATHKQWGRGPHALRASRGKLRGDLKRRLAEKVGRGEGAGKGGPTAKSEKGEAGKGSKGGKGGKGDKPAAAPDRRGRGKGEGQDRSHSKSRDQAKVAGSEGKGKGKGK
eukprot:EG_transcript_22572